MGVDPSYSGAPTGGDKRKAPAATGVAGPTEQQAVSGDEARVVAASAVEESVEAPSDDDDEGRRDAEDSQRASPQPSQVAEAAENDAKKVATAPLLDYAHNVVRRDGGGIGYQTGSSVHFFLSRCDLFLPF